MMKRVLTCLVALSCCVVTVYANADACKGPKVKVINEWDQTIEIKKIKYFDGCDHLWRTRDVTNTEILSPDADGTRHVATFTDTLEYVGNCPVEKFQLYRAVRQDKGSKYGPYAWGAVLVPDGGPKTCNTDVTYTVHAHE